MVTPEALDEVIQTSVDKHGKSGFLLDASRQKIKRLQLEEMASTSALGTLNSLLKLMNMLGSLPTLEAPPS